MHLAVYRVNVFNLSFFSSSNNSERKLFVEENKDCINLYFKYICLTNLPFYYIFTFYFV